jgi:pimeloyl-ACP methyl ester carboxylesterase
MAIFELARIGAWGPTVDAPASFGLLHVLAFLLGRAPHLLLGVAPMVLGVLVGLAAAPTFGVAVARPFGTGGWIASGGLAVVLAVVAFAVARPATTAPIFGSDGREVPGSVAEITKVPIGGHPQALLIRGRSTNLPVLLHLAGGPGGTDIGAMRLDTGLEERFVVATWDQRGTGLSYAAFDPADTLTLERVVADTIEVAEYLRERFGQDRILITGQSWGTIPATLAVQQRPDLFHALVATGPMACIRETDVLFYEDTLAWARSRGDTALVARLEAMGPPPYAEPIGTYPTIVGTERTLNPYPEFDGRTEMTSTIFAPEFGLMGTIGALRGLTDTYARLYPQLQDLDLRIEVPRLDVPVWFLVGRHEARGRVEPAQEWFEALEAPQKHWVVFEGASHRASFERPVEYGRLLDEVMGVVAAGR